jgi:hypothetical protein
MGANAANAQLDRYFHKQSLAIKQQGAAAAAARGKLHMGAKDARTDLNSYFDSLQARTKRGKIQKLSGEVADLTKDVKDILKPMKDLQESASASKEALKGLRSDNLSLRKQLLKDAKERRDEAERTEQAAEHAAEAAAANKPSRDETIVVREALRSKPQREYLKAKEVNPKMTVEGLPPGWSAYMDLKTKYAYFYNENTGKSTWINPKGSRISLKGFPSGWEALQDKGGKDYFVNLKTGASTWEDPRELAGRKVLALMRRGAHRRAAMHRQAIKMASLAALADDHGVYSHIFPRSQWADKDWMKFLDDGHAAAKSAELMTSTQDLKRGGVGREQAMLHRVASRNY